MPGAVQFIYVQEGTDPKEEYEKLCQKRKDSLQPDIANTRYVGSDILDRTYSEAYKEKMYNDVVYKHLGDRGCCHCIDLGIVGYKVRSLIKKSFPQNNKKCRPVYYVYTGDTMVDQAFSSRKEATDYAMDHFCEYVCGIKIVEKYVWDDSGQNERVTDVYDVETKTVKKIPAIMPKGSTVTPIHKYMFYGWAVYDSSGSQENKNEC